MSVHKIKTDRTNISVGVIDPKKEPFIEVNSGDEVEFETWTHWGDAVTADLSFKDIINLREQSQRNNTGPTGPHSLVGPIAVKGAKPGQALRVDIIDIQLKEHGYNIRLPGEFGRGLLPEDFAEGELVHFNLDTEKMTTNLTEEIKIPLHPFLGIMAVAPAGSEPVPSSTLGYYGGNIDVTELGEGSALFLPISQDGGLFYAGDAHAVQGDGEVNLMAIETAFSSVRLKFTLWDKLTRDNPWVETSNHFITLGFGKDLESASKQAVREMIYYLENYHSLSASDAYTLCSVAADLSISQLVNPLVGVHLKLAKNILFKNS